MHTIHCLNNISKHGTDLLAEGYRLVDDLPQAQGVLVRSAAMHGLDFPKGLLAIARAGAGVNNIPLDRCSEEGLVVFNAPGANANAVKEIVVCSLMLGSRDILGGIDWCREHAADADVVKATEKAKKAFAGREARGKKLGVIGLGAVGAEVCNAAVALGMDVYGYDPYVSVGAAWSLSSAVRHVTDLDELFRCCDYLSVHVPETKDTVGIVGERACSLMKGQTVLLNFSRDTLVDNKAAAAALASGALRAYITDFPTPEVMAMKGAIVLPHLGASTAEAEDNCAIMAVRELMDYLENGNIVNSVNYPACHMGRAPEGLRRVAVLHANVPKAISRITQVFGDASVNIENMTNKARGDNAYTLIDLDAGTPGHPDDALERLAAIEGVRRVRVVQ